MKAKTRRAKRQRKKAKLRYENKVVARVEKDLLGRSLFDKVVARVGKDLLGRSLFDKVRAADELGKALADTFLKEMCRPSIARSLFTCTPIKK